VELLGATVDGLLFLVELGALGGRAHLEGYDIRALMHYD
jgi:adenine/guanine phosphoribosyltransferase-like PRPP-binding protein